MFDSVTEKVTELIVKPIETNNARIVNLAKEFVHIDNNTLYLTDNLLWTLNLKPNDKLGLKIEGEAEFELFLVNPRVHFIKDEMTYRITNKHTINVRGKNNQILKQLGSKFSCELSGEGKIKLVPTGTFN